MRAIFLCEYKKLCNDVFAESVVARLSSLCDIDETVYTSADILTDAEKFSDVEIIFSTWGMPKLSEEKIRQYLPNVKCIFYAAGTVQEFARPFLNCGVRVFSGWAANAVPVAEFTVAQIILANKGYFLSSRIYRTEGNQAAKGAINKCRGNYGETVGIIGAGMIGKLVIQMLKQYKLNVLVFDPFLSDENAEKIGVEKCELSELFERAFVVSNHLANNEQTKGMLRYEHFSLMRENAVFINTGRGAQIVEDDLVRALSERHDLTALLDVTCPEPPIEGHPFYTLPNCLLTPHIAGSIGDEIVRIAEYMANEFENYLTDQSCQYEVTHKMLETMA